MEQKIEIHRKMAQNSDSREKFTYNVSLPLLGFVILALMLYMGSNLFGFFKEVPDFKNLSQPEILGRNITFLLLLIGIATATEGKIFRQLQNGDEEADTFWK